MYGGRLTLLPAALIREDGAVLRMSRCEHVTSHSTANWTTRGEIPWLA